MNYKQSVAATIVLTVAALMILYRWVVSIPLPV